MNLEGKVVILTGHTGGIGKVVHEHLTKLGAIVVGASKSTGYDITDIEKSRFLKNEVKNKYGKIDVLINCIGIYGPIGPYEKTNIMDWAFTHNVNFFGPVWLTGFMIPIMKNQGYGKIIYMGGGGFEPLPNFSAYTSSKFALIKFAETIAAELKDSNVQVNVVSPGLVDTPLQDKVLEAGINAGKMYDKITTLRESTPVAQPEQTARLVEYLLNSSITGKVLSAVHDPWENFDPEYLNSTDWFTVKRLDSYTVSKMEGISDEYRDNWLRSDRE